MSESKELRYQLWDVAISIPHPDRLSSMITGHVWVLEELGAMQAIVAFAAKHGADAGTLRYAEAKIGNSVRTVHAGASQETP